MGIARLISDPPNEFNGRALLICREQLIVWQGENNRDVHLQHALWLFGPFFVTMVNSATSLIYICLSIPSSWSWLSASRSCDRQTSGCCKCSRPQKKCDCCPDRILCGNYRRHPSARGRIAASGLLSRAHSRLQPRE